MSCPKVLRIAVKYETQHVEINKTSIKMKIPEEISMKVTDILAKKLGFSYKPVFPRDGELGKILPNGSWTGLIGMLQNNEADLVIRFPSMERQGTMISTYPYYIDSISFACRHPEHVPNPTTFLMPFSSMVWYFLLMSFIATAFVWYALFKKKLSFQEILLYLCSTILRQSLTINPKGPKGYFLISSWISGMSFLGYAYSALLLSYLTIPTLQGVSTIPELASAVVREEYSTFTFPGSFFVTNFNNSSDENMRIIIENLRKNNGHMNIDKILSNRESTYKPAYFASKKHFTAFGNKYFISKDTFFPLISSIVVRKGFTCEKQLNQVISYIWVSGLYQKILDDDSFKKSLKHMLYSNGTKENVGRPLTIGNFTGAFGLLISGYMLSFFTFLIELIIKKGKK